MIQRRLSDYFIFIQNQSGIFYKRSSSSIDICNKLFGRVQCLFVYIQVHFRVSGREKNVTVMTGKRQAPLLPGLNECPDSVRASSNEERVISGIREKTDNSQSPGGEFCNPPSKGIGDIGRDIPVKLWLLSRKERICPW